MRSLCVLLLALAYVKAQQDCRVSDWSEWSDCNSPGRCIKPDDRSWPAPRPEHDEAHERMQEMMLKKMILHEERRKCIDSGRCPELAAKPSSGPQPCVDGMAGEWPCHNVDLVSHINIQDLGYKPVIGDMWNEGNDIWAWTDPQDDAEYVIICLTGGTSFVRISPDPENPEVLGMLYTATTAAIWRDVKVLNNHAYIIAESRNHGMQTFDLTRLRALSHDPDRELVADHWYREVGNSHNIAANEDTNFLYIIGATHTGYPNNCNGGLHMVDVSDPKNPVFAGCFAADGYVHDTQCVVYSGPDARYQGQEICFCYNEDSLTIVDVTDKQNVDMLSREEYEGSQYTHQGWLTKDQRYALMDDELDEQRNAIKNTRTMIWDVSDLTAPVLTNSYYSHHESIDHNQYVLDDYTYQANYEAGFQLLRIDLEGEPDLTFVGSFDVFPTRTTPEFSGAWSCYPYLASGVVPVSSIEYGLFLVRPDWAAIEQQLKAKDAYSEQTRFRHILSAGDPSTCPPLADVRRCTPNTSC